MMDLSKLLDDLNAHQGELLAFAATIELATDVLHAEDADATAVLALAGVSCRLRELANRAEQWIETVNAKQLQQARAA